MRHCRLAGEESGKDKQEKPMGPHCRETNVRKQGGTDFRVRVFSSFAAEHQALPPTWQLEAATVVTAAWGGRLEPATCSRDGAAQSLRGGHLGCVSALLGALPVPSHLLLQTGWGAHGAWASRCQLSGPVSLFPRGQ